MSNPANKEYDASWKYANLDKSLANNITLFKDIFKDDETLVIRDFENKQLKNAKCCIIYIDGMADSEMINRNIIQPVLNHSLSENIEIYDLLEELRKKVIVSSNAAYETNLSKIVSRIIYGDTLFLLEGFNESLIISTQGWKMRSISEPEAAKVTRGPREGFTESIMVNISMVRRKIKNPELKFKFKEIGEKTHTRTCICYIEGIALKGVIKELITRLDKIDIDGILDSGYIQELIRDAPFTPFETVGSSERPDSVAAKLLEGRVALFVDGSPFVLTVPYLVVENFQSNEDYYNNYIFATMNRLIRGIAAVTAVAIPGFYLSIVAFHQEMIPTPLLINLSASRQNVPIPSFLSLLVMLFIFDTLREAGTRIPSQIGHAINIIGTIVLGQAAVEARLVSAPIIIVTALTGIITLINMNFIGATIIWRNLLLIASAFLGIYGFGMMLIVLYMNIMSIRSFGVPYMMNVTRAKNHDGQDAWIRAPWWTMTLRPKILAAKNLVRQSRKNPKEK